ncbi:MAG: tetratricopeptide repeat protein [Planctomycetia bacterium]|nr:tetratricopeptide repeat protein [Planctomycetia bacterium]
MLRFVLVVGVLVGLSELTPARAQFVVGGFPAGYSSSYSYRSGFGFSFSSSRVRVRGFAGGFSSRSVFVSPSPFFGFPTVPIYPYGQFVPVGPFGTVGRFPPVGFAPVGFGSFYGGYGWGPGYWGSGYWGGGYGAFGPPVIVVPQPVIIGGNVPDPNAGAVAGGPPNAELFPKGARPGDFLVIAPQKPATIPEVTRVASVAEVRPAPIPFNPFVRPAPANVERPEADPKREAARLVKLAQGSFASGDYGRAAEHFTRALASDPDDARTYFLLAQARFASGQYADAVTRIREGLAHNPNWPSSAFNPAELYGANPARFDAHLTALRKTIADNPGQATLEFLLGYQLWFRGEKAEAEKFFRAAEKRLAVPGPIALFK